MVRSLSRLITLALMFVVIYGVILVMSGRLGVVIGTRAEPSAAAPASASTAPVTTGCRFEIDSILGRHLQRPVFCVNW